jgi:DMSO/TMAO reductase YedYZ molybdopterin-dependent catalytic subunit
LKTTLLNTSLITITIALALLSSLIPVFAQTPWTLQVNGAVNNPLSLTMDQLAAMPTTTVYASLYCYGALVTEGNWTGVKLSQLLLNAGLDPQARSVEFTASDSYHVAILLADAMRDDVIIAYQKDNQSLSEVLRLVLPNVNGNMWIAKITQITVSTSAISSSQSSKLTPPYFPEHSTGNPLPSAQPSTTPTPAPTPAHTPTPTQPTTTPTDSQTQHQQTPSGSNAWAKYAYAIALAAITAVAATAAVTGYMVRKHRK